MTPRPQETGAALINVLILVSLLGVLAAGVFDRLRLAQHLGASVASRDAATQGLLAGEALALRQLAAARTAGPAAMARLLAPQQLPLPGGSLALHISDAGGCFNLNSVVQGSNGNYAAAAAGVAQLAQLLALAGTSQASAARIASATADWVDSDDQPLPGGAEDPAYARASPAYRTAGTLLADVSEWQAVAGVTPELFNRMAPLLCARPETGPARVNVNALAPAQAPLLALLTGLSLPEVRRLLAQRPPGGWADVAQLPSGSAPGLRQQMAVRSDYMLIRVTASAGPQQWQQISLVRLAGTGPQLLLRQWGAA